MLITCLRLGEKGLMQKFCTNKKPVLQCSACLFLARDIADAEKISSDGVCKECYDNFRFIYGKSWDLGKRPTTEEARSKMRIITKRGKNG